MADNFNVKQFLAENKLGPYSKLKKDIEEAKKEVSKEQKIQVIKEWIWFTCDEGLAKDDVNKYNKMVDMYFADKNDVTKEDFQKIWNKVTEKYGVGDVGADWEAFPETWRDVQRGNLVNPDKQYEAKEEGYMGTQYDSSDDMAVDMVKKGITEREVIYVVRDGKCYRKDDEGNMDEVNMSYCKRFAEGEEKVEEAVSVKSVQKAEMSLQNLLRNIATNANIPTDEKEGLINALGELQDFIDEVGYDSEMEDEYVSDYSRRRASELNEDDKYNIDAKSFGGAIKSDNPEGDALVLRFLQGIAKKFEYPVSHAAMFVKERIKKLGY